MSRSIHQVSFLLFSALGIFGSKVKMESKDFSTSIAQFSAKFCNELPKDKSVVSSPLSAEFVLALLALGTSDPSHSEILRTLGISDDETIRATFKTVSSKLKSIKGITLNVANKVYIKEGPYELQAQIKNDALEVFDAGMEKVDFNNSAAAVGVINQWVESKTNKKIKDLLTEDSVDEFTRVVLVNALYFKGSWKNKFDPANTSDQPFHVNANSTVQVPMMYKEDDYSYGYSEVLKAQLLEIPYVGDEASMLIVLPDEIEGLNGVLAQLAGGHDLTSELSNMHKTKVQVTLPKFKIETEINLKELLPKLGISAIFDANNAAITKLLKDDQGGLFVSKAVQKAFIEVNEEGAEAAAATAMGFMAYSAMINFNPVVSFVADRPFLAVITVAGTPYFHSIYRGDEE